MIICFILVTKQLILCEKCRENLQTDEQAWAESVKRGSVFWLTKRIGDFYGS